MLRHPDSWPSLRYSDWTACCDTLHAISQIPGKLSVQLVPPQPQLMHAALRLTARGLETAPLPAPDGSGAFAVVLDLRTHAAVIEHTSGETRAVALTQRPVAQITGEVMAAVHELAGPVTINPAPQEVTWDTPLDHDEEHRHYDPGQVRRYFAAATQAGLVLGALRAPFRGRASDVNAWWGSFDIAVNLYAGRPADPPSRDFIMRNSMDAEEVSVGWWPGDERHDDAAFFAYAHPAPDGYGRADVAPGRWDDALGEFVLDWSDVIAADDPHVTALYFARRAATHSCDVCEWPSGLAETIESRPPPIG